MGSAEKPAIVVILVTGCAGFRVRLAQQSAKLVVNECTGLAGLAYLVLWSKYVIAIGRRQRRRKRRIGFFDFCQLPQGVIRVAPLDTCLIGVRDYFPNMR